MSAMQTFQQDHLNTQLWNAAREGDCSKIRLLVMSGADLEARDDQARTAINIATQYGQVQAATTLLAARQMSYLVRMGLDAQDLYREPSVAARKRA